MADIIVRRLDESTKARLKDRAKHAGRSLEAEARLVLEASVRPPSADLEALELIPKEESFGAQMQSRFRNRGLTTHEASRFERAMSELQSSDMWRIPDFEA